MITPKKIVVGFFYTLGSGYAARAFSWRGLFGVHTWIATKRQGADHYSVYQVVGWNLYRGRSAVSVSRTDALDGRGARATRIPMPLSGRAANTSALRGSDS